MSTLKEVAWETVLEDYKRNKENYEKSKKVIFHEDRKTVFFECFNKQEQICRRFMKESTKELDSHKLAAILTISLLESDVWEHIESNDGEISIVPEYVAVTVALGYMQNILNDYLEKLNVSTRIENYIFPIALVCDTPYIEIICRTLYYENNPKYENWQLNIMELSEKYYLLEYITLLHYGIDPLELKEKVIIPMQRQEMEKL